VAVALVVTLAPFRFTVPERLPIALGTTRIDLVGNVFLFLPLGFLYRATRGGTVLGVLGRGLLLSLAIESAQLFSRGRYFSPVDLMTNSAGAGLGALVHRAVAGRLHARLAGQLALDLPLMNVVYLVVPLLWLDGLAAGGSSSRILLAPVLGLFGSSVLVAVWRHRLRPAGILTPAGLGLAGALWFLVAGLPGFAGRPVILFAGSVALGLAILGLAVTPGPESLDRRFELLTLRRVAPLFAAYLLLLAAWPWSVTPAPWRMRVGLTGLHDDPGVVPVVRLVETLAAFTLLGYLAAEYRGRREESLGPALGATAVVSMGAAAVLEIARGFHPQQGASLLRLILLGVAGAGGGAIFVAHRDTIRGWRTAAARNAERPVEG
jgi:VanZ family protein